MTLGNAENLTAPRTTRDPAIRQSRVSFPQITSPSGLAPGCGGEVNGELYVKLADGTLVRVTTTPGR